MCSSVDKAKSHFEQFHGMFLILDNSFWEVLETRVLSDHVLLVGVEVIMRSIKNNRMEGRIAPSTTKKEQKPTNT